MKKIYGLVFLILVLLLTACGKSTEEKWQEQYDLGMQYLEEGDYEAAIVAFTAAIEIDPKDIQAYTGLLQAYIGTGDYESAVSTAEQGAEALGDSGQEQADGVVEEFTAVLLTLGELCLDDGEYEFAETIYSLIISVNEILVDAYIARAEMYLLLGEQEKALEDYRKALELLQQGETGSITEDELLALIAEVEESYIDDGIFSETAFNGEEEDIIYVLTEMYNVSVNGYRGLRYEYTYDEYGRMLTSIGYETGPEGIYITEYLLTDDNEEHPSHLYIVDDNDEVYGHGKCVGRYGFGLIGEKTMKRKKGISFVVLLLGLLILLLGLWLWTKTLGTQLLFTYVIIGRVSRYWFIPVLVGAVLFAAAVISVIRKPKLKSENQGEQALAEAETVNQGEQAPAEAETVNQGEQAPAEAETVNQGEQIPTEAETANQEAQAPAEAETVNQEAQALTEAEN